MSILPAIAMRGVNSNISDHDKFNSAIQLLAESLFDKGQSLYCADNLIQWNKNYSFLRDPFYRNIVESSDYSAVEKSIIWRTYTLMYFARIALKADGDFVECGVLSGTTVATVINKLNFGESSKDYYLYDLFEWKEGDLHTKFEQHSDPDLYVQVKKRFLNYPFVKVIKGAIPSSFSIEFPSRIAFAHIDLNNAEPEVASLNAIAPVLSPGGVIVLDDYGWWGYSAQKLALDPVIAAHGLEVLELPTGQGLILKI